MKADIADISTFDLCVCVYTYTYMFALWNGVTTPTKSMGMGEVTINVPIASSIDKQV